VKCQKVIADGTESGTAIYSGTCDDHSCAVKRIRCGVLDADKTRAICLEVAVTRMLALDCPTIVRCNGFSINPPNISVIMELCSNGSLLSVLATHTLSFLTRLKMGCDISNAVSHMHKMELLHRDIKSLNCYVTNEPLQVRLGDFGETISFAAAQHAGPQCTGTTEWMAPEVYLNYKVKYNLRRGIRAGEGVTFAPSADVYSLTVVLWELMTEEVPYSEVRDPISRKKLLGVMLSDHIVSGLRPSNGPIPDGQVGTVSERLQALLELGWHAIPESRPTAEHINLCLQEEKEKQHDIVKPAISISCPQAFHEEFPEGSTSDPSSFVISV